MSIQLTTNATETTVTINEMILKLDQLAVAYAEILEAAKCQLEKYEITDGDWNKLAYRLEKNLSYYTLSNSIVKSMVAALQGDGESDATDGVLRAFTAQIREKVKADLESDLINTRVDSLVRKYFNEERKHMMEAIGRLAEDHVQRHCSQTVKSAEMAKSSMRNMLEITYGEEIRCMIKEAAMQLKQQG